eukprot:4857963-Amphidinium_carterae.2
MAYGSKHQGGTYPYLHMFQFSTSKKRTTQMWLQCLTFEESLLVFLNATRKDMPLVNWPHIHFCFLALECGPQHNLAHVVLQFCTHH